MQCATHPTVETELACSRCGKGICPRCMVHTPVGARCRECAQVRRLPTYNVGATTMLRGALAAVIVGIGVGAIWAFFNIITYFFFGVLAGLGIGYLIGESVSLSTNRRSGPPLQFIAVVGVLIAYFVRTGALFGVGDWGFQDLRTDGFGLVVLVIGGLIAAGRLR